ncbi:MAG: ABC transporter ATP-binding protein [Pseudomonadota bacterium]|nr:ABC transporter ATP-binding protein [Pseudomonadota bacterium]
MTDIEKPMVNITALRKQFGEEVAVDNVHLSVSQGEFVTLLGPSGCGKTTTLRCIAGLERLDAGEISIGDKIVVSADKDIFLYPEEREIGMVFQSYAVWPHMTVFDNVAYGLKVRRINATELRRKTNYALELVGLDHLADRFATKLSGGQRQRVALARAICYEPNVILFDEPLSNLDAKLREQMRDEIVRLQKEVGITSIFVTHDQSEALVMSDRIVVMDKAVIQQIGTPKDIYANPANSFVANFIGVANLFEGSVLGSRGQDSRILIDFGGDLGQKELFAENVNNIADGSNIYLSIRPEDIELSIQELQGDIVNNSIPGKVIETVYLGNFLECRVQIGNYEMIVQLDHFEQLEKDQSVNVAFNSSHGLILKD